MADCLRLCVITFTPIKRLKSKIMSTKLMITSVLLFLLISCSKEDTPNENENQPPVAEEQLVRSIAIISGNEGLGYNFTYNEDNSIKKITSSEGWILEYVYQEELIDKIKVSNGNEIKDFSFEYDEQRKMKSFTLDGQTTLMEFNAQDNSYRYLKSLYGNNYITTMKFNNGGDLINIIDLNSTTQERSELSFEYDLTKKGSEYYTTSVFLQSIIVEVDYIRLLYFGQFSKRPLTLTSGSFNIIYGNSYDDKNYISGSNGILNNVTFTTSFTYSSI